MKGLEKGELIGRVNGVRKMLLLQGRIRFGEPETAINAAMDAITDLDRLEKLTKHLLTVGSWDELLASS